MEPAKIDWKRIESIFVEDELYEHLNAPKWVDFLAPDYSVDDDAWFCTPNCKHPKTADDFHKSTPSKITSSSSLSESLPVRDQNRRDAKLKRRGLTQSSISSTCNPKFNEDGENQNPNLSTPPIHQAKSTKATIKPAAEKRKMTDDVSQNNEAPELKGTFSARNLLMGRDIFNQITEICNELKRMATRARERENIESLSEEKRNVGVDEKEVKKSFEVLREVNGREKERKPLLEVGKEKSLGMGEGNVKGKQRRKKKAADEAENVPISLDSDSVKSKRDETLLHIRTNPPSPQCFSATRGWTKTTASRTAKSSRLMERGGVLEEVDQNMGITKEGSAEKGRGSVVDRREARTLDVFWFLKPCTLSN